MCSWMQTIIKKESDSSREDGILSFTILSLKLLFES